MRSRNLADRSVPRQRELPTFYYHQHFLELLEFVSTHYEHVLSREDSELVTDFGRLDTTAQRLYVRLVNRKGRVFDAGKLAYPELGSLRPLLATLRARGWSCAATSASVRAWCSGATWSCGTTPARRSRFPTVR
mgnify:CR=1 FL=1